MTSFAVLEKPTVLSLLKMIPSGLGLDIAKNHSGVTYWDGETVHTYGFAIQSEYDKEDPFAEYKMRRDLKRSLKEIVSGKHFELCVIEDCYGGENFDTTRKLLALQTVIDELIFEGYCTVGEFYRRKEPEWLSDTRQLYKQRGKLKPKFEVQTILEYLEFDFLLKNKDKSPSELKEIFFEDICDSCGILLSVISRKICETNIAKAPTVKLSDIKMVYVETLEETYGLKDKRIAEEGFIPVELNTRTLEKSISTQVAAHPNDVLCAYLPPAKLGVFGTKHGFSFFDSDEGYLLFYHRRSGSK